MNMVANRWNAILVLLIFFGVIYNFWPSQQSQHLHLQPQPFPDQYGNSELYQEKSYGVKAIVAFSSDSSVSPSSSSSSSEEASVLSNEVTQPSLAHKMSHIEGEIDLSQSILGKINTVQNNKQTLEKISMQASSSSSLSSFLLSSSSSSFSSSSSSSFLSSSSESSSSHILKPSSSSTSSSSWSSSSITEETNHGSKDVISANQTIINQELEDFLKDNQERKVNLNHKCAKFLSGSQEVNGGIGPDFLRHIKPSVHMFTMFPQKSIAWCRTPKVGTTTWAGILLQMYGNKITDHMSYHSKVKKEEKKFIKTSEKRKVLTELKSGKSTMKGMMAARHPLERLYSAFKDKILRRRILLKGVNKPNPKKGPMFQDFLKYIVDRSPTKQNRHWKPLWVLCNPCIYNYEYILKMETFSRDSAGVLQQIGAEELAEINQLNGSSVREVGSNQDHKNILENVDPDTLEKFIDMYYLDFVLFGYNIQEIKAILQDKIKELS